jgi:transposase
MDGRTCRETARLSGVSVATAVKWSQRLRATGTAGAKRQGRKQPRSLAAERTWLLERLEDTPDVTLRRLVVELSERGVVTSYGSVWRIVREAGITFKRTLFATEQDRPAAAGAVAQIPGPA